MLRDSPFRPGRNLPERTENGRSRLPDKAGAGRVNPSSLRASMVSVSPTGSESAAGRAPVGPESAIELVPGKIEG
jgi:hypothetical protein